MMSIRLVDNLKSDTKQKLSTSWEVFRRTFERVAKGKIDTSRKRVYGFDRLPYNEFTTDLEAMSDMHKIEPVQLIPLLRDSKGITNKKETP